MYVPDSTVSRVVNKYFEVINKNCREKQKILSYLKCFLVFFCLSINQLDQNRFTILCWGNLET
jgi:type IV secretory pathway VirB4 component